MWTSCAADERRSPGHSPHEGAPGLWTTLWREIGELLADDFDRDREFDVVVQLGRHGVCAERLDRIHVQLFAVDGDLGLLLDRVGDIGHRDRAVELALGARLGGDGDDLGDQRRGDGLRTFSILPRRAGRDRRIEAA